MIAVTIYLTQFFFVLIIVGLKYIVCKVYCILFYCNIYFKLQKWLY